MLPNSQSEFSGLKNGKRKRVSNDVQDIIGKILAVARRELPLSDIDDNEWETIAKNVLSDPELFPVSLLDIFGPISDCDFDTRRSPSLGHCPSLENCVGQSSSWTSVKI